MLATMILPVTVMAANSGTQSASTSGTSNSINVKAQNYTTDVTSITFPKGAASAVISEPTNSANNTQAFGDSGIAKPVITLVNSADITYNLYYQITMFTNSVVADESYIVLAKGSACADAAAITESVTFDTLTQVTAGAGVATIEKSSSGEASQRDLYLKITLSNTDGLSGTSTLTIYGEVP